MARAPQARALRSKVARGLRPQDDAGFFIFEGQKEKNPGDKPGFNTSIRENKKAGGVLLSHGRCGSAAWREKGKGVRALLSPPALTPYSIAKSPSPCPALAFRSQLRASQARSANVPPPICFAPLRSPLRSRSTLGLSRSWSTT